MRDLRRGVIVSVRTNDQFVDTCRLRVEPGTESIDTTTEIAAQFSTEGVDASGQRRALSVDTTSQRCVSSVDAVVGSGNVGANVAKAHENESYHGDAQSQQSDTDPQHDPSLRVHEARLVRCVSDGTQRGAAGEVGRIPVSVTIPAQDPHNETSFLDSGTSFFDSGHKIGVWTEESGKSCRVKHPSLKGGTCGESPRKPV